MQDSFDDRSSVAERPQVEIHPAFVWTCEECGSENFERAVVHEVSPEEHWELRELYPDQDPDDLGTGTWLTYPGDVACRHCGAQFDAVDPHGQDAEV